MSTVRKAYTSATTPTSNQPYISQVETMLEPGTANAKSKRSIHNLDQYGNRILTKSRCLSIATRLRTAQPTRT